MKLRRTLVARAVALCMTCSVASWSHAATAPVQAPVVPGERLSDWLLRNAGPNADTTALLWTVQAERAPQTRLKQAIIDGLKSTKLLSLPEAERAQLLAWVQAMPVTGRVNVSVADARWLQGNPNQDPVLQEGHSVTLYQRPGTVTVWSGAAQPCVAEHVSGALIQDYLQACLGVGGAAAPDWTWIAQADGSTQRYGVAPWNRTLQ
ncbi:MAG: capsule biosynthesis GfcC family protein, partial [Rhodoferax sp.]|nr:capsule biosynthesis GfcC family protein [Rhodoferax sp.]